MVMKKATGSAVANLLRENIICHSGYQVDSFLIMAHHSRIRMCTV